MKEMVLGQDSNFSLDSFVKCYNSDLANDFGNLLSRVSNLVNKFYNGSLVEGEDLSEDGLAIKKNAKETILNNYKLEKFYDFLNQLTKILADDDFCDPDKNEIYSIWGKDAPSIFNATDVVQFPP